ncbi:putative minor capsid protein L2 [human papillomavirus 85]|uniref:Minor capsid protein L2 n=1 Tax=human papillomavirus 85 TaxID=2848423 RepID=Q9WHG6_9PAPI|nr:putative minor capsid protein L2 [human papillomavirus 85]
MVSHRAARRKRASATDLYKTCKQSGTCPPDVINKVEGTTLADKLLQWTSLGIFLGGLGIGTGSGTGGRTGYIPLGGRPNTVVDVSPARPPVVIESVGPSDPSIVTLVEESSIVTSGAPVPTFTGTSGFEITSSATTTPAVLDITPASGSVQLSSTSFTNPAFTDPSVIEVPQTGEVSGDIFITTPTSGTHGYEEIPMHTFATQGRGTEPISSTPIPGVRRVAGPRLYSQAYQQVKITNSDFISRPSTLVTFTNPAYEPIDTTLTFSPQDVVPDPDFMDIVRLHRPALTSRRGTVRFSRLGKKLTMSTRSGKQIGAQVHYYHDISPISHIGESIEMQPLLPDAAVTADTNGLFDIYADTDIDNNAMLYDRNISDVTQPTTSTISSVSSRYSNTTIPLATSWDVPVHTGPDMTLPTTIPQWPNIVPLLPNNTHSVVLQGTNYYLWPNYYFIFKKRKRVPYFLTDGFVAF